MLKTIQFIISMLINSFISDCGCTLSMFMFIITITFLLLLHVLVSAKKYNSVVSFLNHCLLKNMKRYPQIKTVVLLSDSVGGQNQNIILIKLFNGVGKAYDVETIQLLTVKDYAFSQ